MKNPVKKLFAVAVFMTGASTASADAPRTLGSGAPACGNTMGKSGPDKSCAAELARYEVDTARVELERAQQWEAQAVADLNRMPRTLANGAPACGNTSSKRGRYTCTVDESDKQFDGRIARVVEAAKKLKEARERVKSANAWLARVQRDARNNA